MPVENGFIPTIQQVARKANVSTATVSRVLTGSDPVSESLATRVQQAVSDLGYRPNRSARSLRKRKAQKIGLVVSDIQNPFFASVLRGIDHVLQEASYVLLLGDSDENPLREQTHLDVLQDEGVAGILVVPATNEPHLYLQIQQRGIPLVLIDRLPEGIDADSVTIDNIEAARLATEHLLHLGYERIGLINGPQNIYTAKGRRTGYERALQGAGIRIEESLIKATDFHQEAGYQAMWDLLKQNNPPRAILVASNLTALGALQAIHDRGLSIPDQIAVVGFDDMPWAVSIQPPLTVMAQNPYDLGITAAELILARIKDPDQPVHHVIMETKLIIRASCGALTTIETIPTIS